MCGPSVGVPFSVEYALLRFPFRQAPSWEKWTQMGDVEVLPGKPPPTIQGLSESAGFPASEVAWATWSDGHDRPPPCDAVPGHSRLVNLSTPL